MGGFTWLQPSASPEPQELNQNARPVWKHPFPQLMLLQVVIQAPLSLDMPILCTALLLLTIRLEPLHPPGKGGSLCRAPVSRLQRFSSCRLACANNPFLAYKTTSCLNLAEWHRLWSDLGTTPHGLHLASNWAAYNILRNFF